MPPLLWCFVARLLILEYTDHHQNLSNSSMYYPGALHKISSQSVHNFLSNVVHRQTDRKTNRQTNATKNITSFAKEVNVVFAYSAHVKFKKPSFNSNRDIRQKVVGDCLVEGSFIIYFGLVKINVRNWLMVMENHDF